MGLLDAPGVSPRTLKRLRRRDVPGAVALPPVAAVLPDIVLSDANGATSVSGGATRGPLLQGCYRYYGTNPTQDGNGYYASNYQNVNLNSVGGASPWAIEWISDSPKFEVLTTGKGGTFRLMADSTYLSYSGCFGPPSNGSLYRVLVDWTTQLPAAQARRLRHYRLEASGAFTFGGLFLPASDTVNAPAYKGQRIVVMGDSFSEPTVVDTSLSRTVTDGVTTSGSPTLTSTTASFTQYDRYALITGSGIPANTWIKSVQSATSITLSANATATATGVSTTVQQQVSKHEGWGSVFAKMLGCPDVWLQASGGTGYLNPGTGGRVTFPTRFAHDALVPAPDLIIIAGGINDAGRSASLGYTAAAAGLALASMLTQVASTLPDCDVTVLSPFLGKFGTLLQPGGIADNYLQMRDAIRASAAAAKVRYLDVIETGVTGATSTVSSNSTGSGLNANDPIPQGTIVRVGTAAASWTTRVIAGPTGTGPYSHTCSPNTSTTWPPGTPIAVVGPSFIDGTGTQGSPASNGNSDYFVGNDNTHPTVAGHENLARWVFKLYAASLAA